MDCRPVRVGSLHFGFVAEGEEVLRYGESVFDGACRQAVVDDVDKAYLLACSDQLFCQCQSLACICGDFPLREVDDGDL